MSQRLDAIERMGATLVEAPLGRPRGVVFNILWAAWLGAYLTFIVTQAIQEPTDAWNWVFMVVYVVLIALHTVSSALARRRDLELQHTGIGFLVKVAQMGVGSAELDTKRAIERMVELELLLAEHGIEVPSAD